ncbi:hypothetical protein BT96DRAFT_1001310 [Gymnopus androsaceus JB14]|uniref:Uncharacterized protein n=1 Tax=Gymnopus androsaceus JB14 TaxID=1447944 RepID=A0A6A4GZQ2_9AGAR|nr:hypothetical protein BT96DRAFT_1001310 [Gymnopus androsaceus JB14]
MPSQFVFKDPIVNNNIDASALCEEGPMVISQPVLALINRSDAPTPAPKYRPAASHIGDFLNASGVPKCKFNAADDEEPEQPSKKSEASKLVKKAAKKSSVPITAKGKKFCPGSKASIVEAQMAETRAQLKEMHQERAQEEEEEDE